MQNKKNIYIFTLYPEIGASSNYRAFIFRDVLDEKYNAEWHPFWNERYVSIYMHNKKRYALLIVLQYVLAAIIRVIQFLYIAPKMDIVFIQKGIIPKCKNTFLRKMKKNGVRIVYDVDDAIYTDSRDNSDSIAREVDVVICGNDVLKKHYLKYNNNCILLPTVENTIKYERFWKNTFDKKIIGWIGSKTTIDNLDIVIDALNEVSDKHPEVSINIISNTPLDYTHKINNSVFIPWDKESYISDLSNFTIGIMPLKDNEVNRGKCGFKLIQYLNMKKPVVGSDVGINAEIIGENGIVAIDEHRWSEYFEKLLFDEVMYQECVNNIECSFLKKYHFNTVSEKLVNILEGNLYVENE